MSRFGTRVRGSQAVSTWLRGGGTGIQSIERFTITIAAGATSNTRVLTTAVDTTRTRVVLLGITIAGAETQVDTTAMRVALTNGTTVTAFVNSTGAGDRVVACEVIQYLPGVIKAIRRGTITTTGSATGTDTFTAVDTAETTIDYLGFTSDFTTAPAPGNSLCRVEVTNATTTTATGQGALNRTVGYQVVEWN